MTMVSRTNNVLCLDGVLAYWIRDVASNFFLINAGAVTLNTESCPQCRERVIVFDVRGRQLSCIDRGDRSTHRVLAIRGVFVVVAACAYGVADKFNVGTNISVRAGVGPA